MWRAGGELGRPSLVPSVSCPTPPKLEEMVVLNSRVWIPVHLPMVSRPSLRFFGQTVTTCMPLLRVQGACSRPPT